MGHLDFKSSMSIFLQELVCSIPLVGIVINCQSSQEVTIPVLANLNNKDFGVGTIELSMPDTQLFYSSARITVTTSLFGIRYLMRHWFVATALAVIMSLSLSLFAGTLFSFFMVKGIVKVMLLRLYPQPKKKDDDDSQADTSEEEDVRQERDMSRTERLIVFIFKALVW